MIGENGFGASSVKWVKNWMNPKQEVLEFDSKNGGKTSIVFGDNSINIWDNNIKESLYIAELNNDSVIGGGL